MSIGSFDILGAAGSAGSSFGVSNAAFPVIYRRDALRELSAMRHIHADDVVAERERRARMQDVERLRPTRSSGSLQQSREN